MRPRQGPCMAGHRNPGHAAGSGHFHTDARTQAGTENLLPRGNCLAHGLHFLGTAGGPRIATQVQRVWFVPAACSTGRGRARMNFDATSLPGVTLITPKVYGDDRGFFFESWNEREFAGAGLSQHFVQDNHSRSAKNVLRGLHYQMRQPQGKLVRVIAGEIFDVAVDIRKSSPNFGRWFGCTINAMGKKMLWVPIGFAHGFLVVSESAEVLYKTTDFYAPEHERTIAWNDPAMAIDWPLDGEPLLSAKDREGTALHDSELFT